MTDDIVARLRSMAAIGWNPIGDEAADEIERLRETIKRQANAVKTLQACEETEINRLRKTHHKAAIAERTLDSERDANALLTEEIERLRKELRIMHSIEYVIDNHGIAHKAVTIVYRDDGSDQ